MVAVTGNYMRRDRPGDFREPRQLSKQEIKEIEDAIRNIRVGWRRDDKYGVAGGGIGRRRFKLTASWIATTCRGETLRSGMKLAYRVTPPEQSGQIPGQPRGNTGEEVMRWRLMNILTVKLPA